MAKMEGTSDFRLSEGYSFWTCLLRVENVRFSA